MHLPQHKRPATYSAKIKRFVTLYVFVASLARMATGGAALAIVLLSDLHGLDGKSTGFLAACLTGPHVLGPLYGRWLDRQTKPLWLIAIATFVFSLVFQFALWRFDSQLNWTTVAALIVCGCCSSFMMGGLSTQLAKTVREKSSIRRKAQSWDTFTYGFGLTVGPAFIALFNGYLPLQSVISILMCLPIMSGLLMLLLHKFSLEQSQKGKKAANMRQVVNTIIQSAPLKNTILMTCAAAFAVAALPITAVYMTKQWVLNTEASAMLVSLYGMGSLTGSFWLLMRPMQSESILLLKRLGIVFLFGLVLVAMSQNYASAMIGYFLLGAINALFFSATLAARTEHAPESGAAQIFMWVAAAKIVSASLGSIVAGFLVELSAFVAVMGSAVVLLSCWLLCFSPGSKQKTQNHITQ